MAIMNGVTLKHTCVPYRMHGSVLIIFVIEFKSGNSKTHRDTVHIVHPRLYYDDYCYSYYLLNPSDELLWALWTARRALQTESLLSVHSLPAAPAGRINTSALI